MGGIAAEYCDAAVLLLQHGIAEFRIHFSQLPHQPVSHELWRHKTGVPKRSRFQVRDRLANRGYDTIGKPGPRPGLKFAREGLADGAPAPTTQAGVGMRGAEVEL